MWPSWAGPATSAGWPQGRVVANGKTCDEKGTRRLIGKGCLWPALVLDPVLGGVCAHYHSTRAVQLGGLRPEKVLAFIAGGTVDGSSHGG